MSDPDKIIAELESEFVELYKILKFEGLSESGGSAKQAIADGNRPSVIVRGSASPRPRSPPLLAPQHLHQKPHLT